MKPEEMRALYEYNAWADHRSLDAAAHLPNEQFTKPMGSSFSSVRDTLAHIYGVGVVVAGAVSGALACIASGCPGVRGRAKPSSKVGGR